MFGADKATDNTGLRAGFTIGRVINVLIILIFVAALISSFVVIGGLNNLHLDVLSDQTYKAHYINYTNSSANVQLPHFCELYSSFDKNAKSNFTFNSQYSCEFVIATNAILVVAECVLVVAAVVRTILAQNLHFTVFIEFGVMFLATVFAFIIGVALSIGVEITCNAVGSYYSSSCVNQVFPFTQVQFYSVLNVTQAAMWFTFMFLFIILIVFIARMVVYLQRQMRGRGTLPSASREEYDPIIEDKTKNGQGGPMTRPI